MSECHCHQGWICEEHPDKPWPHDACAGPGTRCDNPDCPWWQHRPRPAALDTSDWQDAVATTVTRLEALG